MLRLSHRKKVLSSERENGLSAGRATVPGMNTFHVVLTRTGPEWLSGKPMEEQSDWAEHAAFMDDLTEKGFIVLGGPLSDEVRVVHVVEAESEDAVRATLAADPWSGSHLVIDSVDPWTIRLTRK